MGDYAEYYRNASHTERRHALGTLWRIVLLLAIIVTSIVWSYAAHAQTAWTFCAAENATCTFTGTKQVRYGEPFNNRWSPTRTMTSPVLCNNTTFAPDPSPGTGKRCEIMDAANTPTPIPTPPVNSGWDTKMTVSWSAPTTNTDGSPVCGPLTYKVKLNNTVSASTPSLSHTFTNLLAGDYTVTVAAVGSCGESVDSNPMSAKVTSNPPPCYGKFKNGTGTWERARVNLSGWAAVWQCPNPDGSWSYASLVGLWADMDEDWEIQNAQADTKEEMDALWRARVGYKPADHYAAVRPMVDAIKADWPLQASSPPAPTFVVKPYGTSTTRPAYAVVNGARTSTVAGRVAVLASPGVGTTCDCAKFRSGDYCFVEGKPNVLTADPSDVLGPSAAVCSEVK